MGQVALRRAGPPSFLDIWFWWACARSELVPPYIEKGDCLGFVPRINPLAPFGLVPMEAGLCTKSHCITVHGAKDCFHRDEPEGGVLSCPFKGRPEAIPIKAKISCG